MDVPGAASSASRHSMIIGSPRFPAGSSSTAAGPANQNATDKLSDLGISKRERPVPSRQNSLTNTSSSSTSTTATLDPRRPRTYSAPVLPIQPGTSAMSEALNSSNPARPNLIRRLSRGAANRLSRRRTSSAHDRDDTHGPVLMRHRSNSNASDTDPFQMDPESPEYEFITKSEGQTTQITEGDPETPEPDIVGPDEGPPEIPVLLQTGTPMTRVTKRKKTLRYFVLESHNARVSWDPLKPSARFYVDDVREIRTSENARNYREDCHVSFEFEDRWITVIYSEHAENGRLRTLHLVAPTVELFQLWTTTLESLLNYRTALMSGISSHGEHVLGTHWKREISSQSSVKSLEETDEKLSFEEVERLCRRLQVNCSRQYLRSMFDRADTQKSGFLTFEQFKNFVRILKERSDIVEIWGRVAEDPQQGMREDEFRNFLKNIQKIDVEATDANVNSLFAKFVKRSKLASERAGETIEPQRISIAGFTDYLMSPTYNAPLKGLTDDERNLDRPLNEYFISSSHNTYLLERQVAGESSIEGYIRTLQRGCRCVEIDCWDGDAHDNYKPVVTHGRTLTSKVAFSDVIQTIRKFAFVSSQYPVILSLEVHCSFDQQNIMAENLRTILGDKLVVLPLISNSMILPSPNDLKGKILVKVKGHDELVTLSMDISELQSISSGVRAKAPKDNAGGATASSSNSTEDSDELGTSSGGSLRSNSLRKPRQAASKITKNLGELGVYCRGIKFKNFSLPESKSFNHVFSLAERTFISLCKDKEKKAQLEKHNLRYLMRVYPSGWRVTSRNFDPLTFWRRGVQMVALNWQTYDTGVQLNDAMFASASERPGYVLKPEELRSSKFVVDSVATDTLTSKLGRRLVKFSVEIISAQQLPRVGKDRDCVDSYVEVEVFSADDKARGLVTANGGIDKSGSGGMSGLGAPQRRRTKVVKGNLFAPRWNEQLSFSVETRFESLVFIRFGVYNDDGNGDRTLKASYCMKLANAAQGYRHLPLYDMGGEQFLFSSLFVKMDIEPIAQALPAAIKQSTVNALKSAAKNMLRISSDYLHGVSTDQHPASTAVPSSAAAGAGGEGGAGAGNNSGSTGEKH